jgi:hypothetical protein
MLVQTKKRREDWLDQRPAGSNTVREEKHLDKALENAGSFEAAGFSLEVSSSVPPY